MKPLLYDLTEIFIDLSKCSEDEQKYISKITNYKIYDINVCPMMFLMQTEYYTTEWDQCSKDSSITNEKTELLYPEFIKLFEGGEGENIDYKSEFEKLKSLVMSDSVFLCLRRGIKNPSDFDFEDYGYIELNNWIKANSK